MTARVLVLNCGSSSIKYRLLDMGDGEVLASGLVERIGEESSLLVHRGTSRIERPGSCATHAEGMRAVLDAFAEAGPSLEGITAVGHRVVHGGSRYSTPVLIDDGVEQAIEELSPLAPLHNPANLTGIRVAREAFPGPPHVAVFDTAFHQTMPPASYLYAVPREWTDEGVRRYGFHGTSHAYVSRAAAGLAGRSLAETNTIVLHLGNGASASAVRGGVCVDTSMGLTPLEGLVMGTRSGDLDPALIPYLVRTRKMSVDEIDDALNTRSGLLGLCGANDMREVWRRVDAGDADAAEAVEVATQRVKKYVGAYYALLGRLDCIAFTAGVGENDHRTRALSLAGLHPLGIELDPAANAVRSAEPRTISTPGSAVRVMVVPTNEELEIAGQTLAVALGQRT
ncbi:acetate kinase [Actinocorallia longicatena]|uniref:Acetate kinase n=1 Tax=Actinocorallia longicatena TaxID=111803 RepID=A0ABP6Q9N8_9ACTN